MVSRCAFLAFLLNAMPVIAEISLEDLGNTQIRQPSATRPIELGDMVGLRSIDSLILSPDKTGYAIRVRQGNAEKNVITSGWFIGSTARESLTYVGDGGDVRPEVTRYGDLDGTNFEASARWSPDGSRIAYIATKNGERQIWCGDKHGSVWQITHSQADVTQLFWNKEGNNIYFAVGSARRKVMEEQEQKERSGFNYDKDLYAITDLMWSPRRREPPQATAWWVALTNGASEWPASRSDLRELELERQSNLTPEPTDVVKAYSDPGRRLLTSAPNGNKAWLNSVIIGSSNTRLAARLGSKEITCTEEECYGVIADLWWVPGQETVRFWRAEGLGLATFGAYDWSPRTGNVTTLLRIQDDSLRYCSRLSAAQILCVRETKSVPPHVALVDLAAGTVKILADVNPEFKHIRLGKIERFEWSTPEFPWNDSGGKLAGIFPRRAYGYILYPPDFDPKKKYPVFIEPYVATGFNGWDPEHPLHVYAASGIVVLNMSFPIEDLDIVATMGPDSYTDVMYSSELGFPRLSMYMDSTIRGLATAEARGFVDATRVGAGGVSHGTFVPLYMVQMYDKLAAISISNPYWSGLQYYSVSKKGYEAWAKHYTFVAKPDAVGREYWNKIDISEHVDKIECPILMNLADREAFYLLPLIRNMSDEGKAYETYIYPQETHIKWQPAHLSMIMQRNLDWFRFWLQDYKDPEPSKRSQYTNWETLRQLQCHNPRSLLTHC